MNKAFRALLASLALAMLLGAAGTSCASTSSNRPSATNANRLDTADFRRSEFRTVYDAIRALRPDWLIARGGATSINNSTRRTPTVGVFIEGESRGYGLDKLTEFVGRDVVLIRRISGSESLATYGADWPWGGIVISRGSR